jgi:hypothetical protein
VPQVILAAGLRGAVRGMRSEKGGVRLKMIINAGPLHYSVSGVTGFDLAINSYWEIGDRAVPDVMVAFAVPLKIATIFS